MNHDELMNQIRTTKIVFSQSEEQATASIQKTDPALHKTSNFT